MVESMQFSISLRFCLLGMRAALLAAVSQDCPEVELSTLYCGTPLSMEFCSKLTSIHVGLLQPSNLGNSSVSKHGNRFKPHPAELFSISAALSLAHHPTSSKGELHTERSTAVWCSPMVHTNGHIPTGTRYMLSNSFWRIDWVFILSPARPCTPSK